MSKFLTQICIVFTKRWNISQLGVHSPQPEHIHMKQQPQFCIHRSKQPFSKSQQIRNQSCRTYLNSECEYEQLWKSKLQVENLYFVLWSQTQTCYFNPTYFFLCTISHFHRLKNKRNSYNSNIQEQIDANYSHLISPSDFKGLAPNKAIWPQNL